MRKLLNNRISYLFDYIFAKIYHNLKGGAEGKYWQTLNKDMIISNLNLIMFWVSYENINWND